jgi:hypothetical protein
MGREDDRERAARAGFDHHLLKPVAPDELVRLLAAVTPAPWLRAAFEQTSCPLPSARCGSKHPEIESPPAREP